MAALDRLVDPGLGSAGIGALGACGDLKLRLIKKWLKAGVSEDGQWSETKLGTPQGAVVSPLLANVYPTQPASTGAVGATNPTVEPMGSPTSRPASLSRRTLLRHSSFVRAVCVDALVRICAGGDQR